MLNQAELPRLFERARSSGLATAEWYAERFYCTVIEQYERIQETRLSAGEGICLRAERGEQFIERIGDDLSARGLGLLLGEPDLPPLEERSPFPAGRSLPAEALTILTQLQRGMNDCDLGQSTRWNLTSRTRTFARVSEDRPATSGTEEEAHIIFEWQSPDKKKYREERCRSSLKALLSDLANTNPFLDSVKRSLTRAEPWPAPKGDMPVHWSPRSVAKLCLPFLRAFEGDRVHQQRSFLSSVAGPLGFSFVVEEEPSVKFDHEGMPTEKRIIFDGDSALTLFVDQLIARKLGVVPTGHCRRESFRSQPTVGFWHPRIVGKRTSAVPLGGLNWGLSVRDLEVSDLDLIRGRVRLSLNDVKLIHHGQEGESIAPIAMETSLLALLASWTLFSRDSQTNGFRVHKMGQSLTAEISAPHALCERFPIPGQVPLQYYW